MTTFNLPPALAPAGFEWGIQKSGLQFTAPYNGTTQAVEFPGERWTVAFSLPPRMHAEAGTVEALMNQLAGGVNRLRMWHQGTGNPSDRGAPRGTLRGSPVLAATATRGNATLSITTTAGATLLMGDMIGCGTHLFQTAADATANGTGLLVMPLVNRVRSTIAPGAAVVWNKPTADFILLAMAMRHSYVPLVLLGGTFDLVEVW